MSKIDFFTTHPSANLSNCDYELVSMGNHSGLLKILDSPAPRLTIPVISSNLLANVRKLPNSIFIPEPNNFLILILICNSFRFDFAASYSFEAYISGTFTSGGVFCGTNTTGVSPFQYADHLGISENKASIRCRKSNGLRIDKEIQSKKGSNKKEELTSFFVFGGRGISTFLLTLSLNLVQRFTN